MATPDRGFKVDDTNEMSKVNDPDTVIMVRMLFSKCPALTSVQTHKVPSCVLRESDYAGSFISMFITLLSVQKLGVMSQYVLNRRNIYTT